MTHAIGFFLSRNRDANSLSNSLLGDGLATASLSPVNTYYYCYSMYVPVCKLHGTHLGDCSGRPLYPEDVLRHWPCVRQRAQSGEPAQGHPPSCNNDNIP